jgi:mitochondrial fission protein ELM1
LRDKLADVPAVIWDGSGENPYFAYLGLADHIVVTADSVSMVSEACSTGKPVYVVELEGGSQKFRRFHEGLRSDGITREFTGVLANWRYAPLDDTQRAAAEVRRRLAQR